MTTHVRRLAWGLAVLALLAPVARGQEPAAPAAAKIFTRKKAFKLPLQILDRDRAQLQEVRLYVKSGAAGPWAFAQAAVPTQKEFIYRVSDDGEYWFSVVIIDKKGRPTPADFTREPPALVVVVDTQPPEIELRAPAGGPGDSSVRCVVQDANADPSKVKVECQGDGVTWQPLEPMPGKPGSYRLPPGASAVVVRATATDRAGNSAVREVRVVPPTPVVQNPTTPDAGANVPKSGTGPVEPSKFVYAESSSGTSPTPAKAAAAKPPEPGAKAADGNPAIVNGSPLEKVHPMVGVAAELHPDKGGAHARAEVEQAVPLPTAPPAAPRRQLINGTHIALKYQADPSGLRDQDRVTVWMTRDQGTTWQRLCEDPDRKSPVAIELPGDGVYGLSIVVGGANESPAAGEAPSFVVEVDTTKPTAQLLGVYPEEGEGVYTITWSASDRNLKPDPINLFYATSREGPWLLIAKGVQNNGRYRWQPPEAEGPEFFVRMEVSDRAGNTTRCDLLHPVVLDEPHTKVRRVGFTAPGGPAVPPGN